MANETYQFSAYNSPQNKGKRSFYGGLTDAEKNALNSEVGKKAYRYDWRDDESFSDFARRAFNQGAQQFGGMDPYAAVQSPYQRWFLSSYPEVAASRYMLQRLLGAPDNAFAEGMEGYLREFMGGQDILRSPSKAGGEIGALKGLIERVAAGDLEGLTAEQQETIKQLLNTPSGVASLVNAAVSGSWSPLARRQIQREMSGYLSRFYEDPDFVMGLERDRVPFASWLLSQVGF